MQGRLNRLVQATLPTVASPTLTCLDRPCNHSNHAPQPILAVESGMTLLKAKPTFIEVPMRTFKLCVSSTLISTTIFLTSCILFHLEVLWRGCHLLPCALVAILLL